MTPTQALTLQPGDVVLHISQLFQVQAVERGGYTLLHLRGKFRDVMVPPRSVALVYRKDERPADLQLGHLTTEQEARILAVIAQRTHDTTTSREG